jgi:hypothetical protein
LAKSQQSAQSPASSVENLKWLEGSWKRTNTKAGRSGMELWTKVSSTELKGKGITMHGTDTAFVEKLRIVVRDGELYYVADVPENQKPVYFRFTELKASSFTCENPDHDFPKKISYSVNDNRLSAKISGDGKEIEYLFVRNP